MKFRTNKVKTKSEIWELRRQAGYALQKLRLLAKTDLAALEVLADELSLHIRGLKRDAFDSPDHYRKLIRRCASWPDFITVDKDFKAGQALFASYMKLGEDAAENYKGRQWTRDTPEVRAALAVRSCLINHGIDLPPLTRKPDTSPDWWRAGRKFFKAIYGEHFEDHPAFKEYDTPTNRQAAFRVSKPFGKWKRQRILSKMPQGFHSIAPKQ